MENLASGLFFDGIDKHFGGTYALKDVSLSVGRGEIVALLGENGAGKSTLIKVLGGIHSADAGRVLIDGADIGQFSRRDLTKWIGYVPQEIRLFSGSIRDNISAAHPDAPDEDVIRAARLAGVHNFIAALPEGYGADVGDGGQWYAAIGDAA